MCFDGLIHHVFDFLLQHFFVSFFNLHKRLNSIIIELGFQKCGRLAHSCLIFTFVGQNASFPYEFVELLRLVWIEMMTSIRDYLYIHIWLPLKISSFKFLLWYWCSWRFPVSSAVHSRGFCRSRNLFRRWLWLEEIHVLNHICKSLDF